MSLSHVYSPYLGRYVLEQAPLAGFNFTVTDANTGLPIQGAHCLIFAGPDCTGDADGVYTDSQGKAGIDAIWFAPRSWMVSKEGYIPIRSNYVTSQITVALESTEIIYTVRIFAGTGGTTDPRGTISVAPNTKLTVTAIPDGGYEFNYWVYKGQNVGSANPATFIIDRNSITITAVFKESEAPPPPPPPPPPPSPWPVTRQYPYENIVLNPGPLLEASETKDVGPVDTDVLLGAVLDYKITYQSGVLKGVRAYIYWNDEEIAYHHLGSSDIGAPVTGTINLGTGRIRASNTLKVRMYQGPLGFNVARFDLVLTLGYSEDPAEEPKPPFPWPELAWWHWAIIGGVALGILYIVVVRPAPPTIITVPYPVLRSKEGE